MNDVVLLGYSTAGKSSALKYFFEKFPDQVFCVDIDYLIAAYHNHHIYNVFFSLIQEKGNRDEIFPFIQNRENSILSDLKIKPASPRLIAGGPHIVDSQMWDQYVNVRKPICIQLAVTPEYAYEGLMSRRDRHSAEGLDKHKYFGCWDQKVTTEYDLLKDQYILISKDQAINNIQNGISYLESKYKKYCDERIFDAEKLSKYSMKYEANYHSYFISEIVRCLDVI